MGKVPIVQTTLSGILSRANCVAYFSGAGWLLYLRKVFLAVSCSKKKLRTWQNVLNCSWHMSIRSV